MFCLVELAQHISYKWSFNLTKARHIWKPEELISKRKGTEWVTSEIKKKWVINISERQLTEIGKGLFNKDINFSITSKRRPNKIMMLLSKKQWRILKSIKLLKKRILWLIIHYILNIYDFLFVITTTKIFQKSHI